jgi:hypothetical protein
VKNIETKGLNRTKNSLVQKKEARKRKRPLSQYTDSKYDAAFTINAMSDNDDDPELIASEVKRYLSIRPSYRSDQVSHR